MTSPIRLRTTTTASSPTKPARDRDRPRRADGCSAARAAALVGRASVRGGAWCIRRPPARARRGRSRRRARRSCDTNRTTRSPATAAPHRRPVPHGGRGDCFVHRARLGDRHARPRTRPRRRPPTLRWRRRRARGRPWRRARVRSRPLLRPPAIRTTWSKPATAAAVACGAVALESSYHRIPSASTTNATRWGRPLNVVSTARTASIEAPASSAVAAAASAFATSCGSARGSASTAISGSPVGATSSARTHAVVAGVFPEGDVTRGRVGERGHHDRVVRVADRDGVGRLVLEDARLCLPVGVDGAVPVEMVGGEVQPRCHLRGEPLGEPQPERRRLDDEHVDGFVQSGNEGHVGVSDRERLAARRVEHVGDHRRHRGLAVGASDCHDRPVRVVPIGREIELAHASDVRDGTPRRSRDGARERRGSARACRPTRARSRARRLAGAGARRRHAVRRRRASTSMPRAPERGRDGLAGDPHPVHERAHQSATPMWMKSA